MKKSYLMIAVAAIAMVSCAQDDQLRNGVSQEKQEAISFASFSEKASRATTPLNLEDYHKTFAVYGTKNGADGIQRVFDNVKCTYASGDELYGDWRYDTPRYWDKQSSYKFAAFAPDFAPIYFNYAVGKEIASGDGYWVSTEPYTILGQNLMQEQGVASGDWNTTFNGIDGKKDIDIMIADFAERKLVSGVIESTATVDLQFHHTLAKLLVAAKAAKDLTASGEGYLVKIKSIKANDFLSTGSYNTDKWTAASGNVVNYVYNASDDAVATTVETKVASGEAIQLTTAPTYFIESLVMPQAVAEAQQIVVEYEIESKSLNASGDAVSYSEAFTRKIDVDEILVNASGDASTTRYNESYKYLLTLIIDPQIITFDAKVTDWGNGDAKDYTIE